MQRRLDARVYAHVTTAATAALAEASAVLGKSQATLAEFERSAQMLREQSARDHENTERLRADTLDSAGAVLEKVENTLDQVQTRATQSAKEIGETRLGTDVLGRDVLTRLLYGARISLTTGFVVVDVRTVAGRGCRRPR